MRRKTFVIVAEKDSITVRSFISHVLPMVTDWFGFCLALWVLPVPLDRIAMMMNLSFTMSVALYVGGDDDLGSGGK